MSQNYVIRSVQMIYQKSVHLIYRKVRNRVKKCVQMQCTAA
jgi:hypothetical protein